MLLCKIYLALAADGERITGDPEVIPREGLPTSWTQLWGLSICAQGRLPILIVPALCNQFKC
jgi:hypothetical protein